MSQPSRGGVRHETVGPDRAGQRLDNFLISLLGPVPKSLVYRLVRTGQVRVNGSRAKPMKKLRAGDEVRVPPVKQPDSVPGSLPAGLVERVRACIVDQTEDYVILDKPAGLAMHGGSGLSYGLMDAIAKIDERWRPVHRLDRPTSGLIVLACHHQALRRLQQSFVAREVDKRYLALLDGILPEDRVCVDAPLKKIRDGSGQHRVIVDEEGQSARSTFHLLERVGGYSYVEVRIETGRTHQIRAHAASIGLPLVGDELYNPKPCPDGLNRLFLHAHYLRLSWPEDRVYSSPLPAELAQALEHLRAA
ncbi:RluA family pseudouridine synthase [Wenzhouxiangella marina]|uniref:Pseudouridine synthase n=1 Tax=Wenzhouxiangella marina TaxID=1579979 RepID=A0A0K0XX59_9GAMM|nr:RluA family pseudouridine synthase [Wenzhouxiangella marina]AKS42196.1 23S rRNA pseudouridylate synthase [Wenzhouxiangella marina]MBB6086032.1 23S rRNA pseudouridine955/2504/2580 synthase [Wenzhouxiangella marina]